MIFGLAPKSSSRSSAADASAMAYIVTKQPLLCRLLRRHRPNHRQGTPPMATRRQLARRRRSNRREPHRRTDLVRDGARSAATLTDLRERHMASLNASIIGPSTTASGTAGSSTTTSPPPSATPHPILARRAPRPPLHRLLGPGGATGPDLHPRPSTRSTSSSAPRSTRRATAGSSHTTSRSTHRTAAAARDKQGPEAWTSTNSPTSSTPPNTSASIRRCTSQRSPECDAAKSPGCAGATGTTPRIGSRSTAADKSVGGHSVEVAPKTQNSRRCIDLDPHTETSSPLAAPPGTTTVTPSDSTTPSSPTPTGDPLHPESISQLFTRNSPASISRQSGSTICATPTPHCSSRIEYADQGRVRTARPRTPRLHDGHLPTRHARHGRHRRPRLRPMLSTQRDTRQGYRRHAVRPASGRRLPAQIRKAPAHRIATTTAGR